MNIVEPTSMATLSAELVGVALVCVAVLLVVGWLVVRLLHAAAVLGLLMLAAYLISTLPPHGPG